MADEKTGILTNGEQDQKIFDLCKEIALQNKELKIISDNLKDLSTDLKDVCGCLKEQDKRIQTLEKEVTRHSVYIGLIAIGIGVLITQFINRVWALVGR